MVPVQISTKVEGKAYTAALRCVIKGQEHVLKVQGEGNPQRFSPTPGVTGNYGKFKPHDKAVRDHD